MEDYVAEEKERVRRTVTDEIIRMENDFDAARNAKKIIVDKMMESVSKINILDDDNKLTESTDVALRVMSSTIKALESMEKSAATAVGIKLRNKELDMAAEADSKNRIAAILMSVSPKKIEESFPTASLEEHLEQMFDSDIKDTELKLSPTCLNE